MSEQDTYKKRLELALEAAGLDLWENDLVTGDVPHKATKTFTELGYNENEIAAYIDDLFQVIHPDDVALVKAAVNNHLTGITPQYRCEFRIRSKNSTWVWYANYGRIMDSEEGNRGQRFIGVTFNIDDRKCKEEELDLINRKLTEQNELLRRSEEALMESQLIAGLGTYELNISTGVWESSDVLDKLFGIQKSYRRTIDGWESLLHPDDRTMLDDYLKIEVIGQGKPFDKEYRIIRHNDQVVRWQHGLGKLEFDVQGRPHKMHGTIQDITDRKNMEKKIHDMAFHDSLTQLPNRRLLMDRLELAIASSKRSGCFVALMFLDLDNFKPLNDAHGHEVGDMLLQEAAGRISCCVREVDTIARFGGDEFVVVLNELDIDKTKSISQAGTVAEKIRSILDKPYVLKVQREGIVINVIEHHCSSSIGVVVFNNNDVSREEILKQADSAMYKAKDAGRNMIRFYAG